MHFTEAMSLFSGLKSKKPFIEECFFPVIAEKYITISTENHQSKQWDHFQEYIDLIMPILNKHNIHIVEVGRNDVKLKSITILKTVTNENHWSFIVKNSLLHIGPESFISSLASYHNTPSITLFSNTSAEYSSPDWIASECEKIFINSLRDGVKPSFSPQELNKSINQISAEEVASKTLNFLNIGNDFDKYDVIYTGQAFHGKIIEIIPDFAPDNDFFPRSLINIRLDYHFNLDHILNFASIRKIAIISSKEIDEDILSQVKPNLENLFFKVNESSDVNYFEDLKRKGYLINLVLNHGADPSETRFNFFDWNVIDDNKISKKDLDSLGKICDTTRYKSSKTIFSKDGQFSSKSSYDQKINSHKDEMILDDAAFWNESDRYKLYNLR